MISGKWPTIEELKKTSKIVELADKTLINIDELKTAISIDLFLCGTISDNQSLSRLNALVTHALEKAARNGNLEFVKLVLDHWDDANNELRKVSTRYFGYAFSIAMMYGHYDVAKLFLNDKLRNTIFINYPYLDNQKTPLMLAEEGKDQSLVEQLKNNGLWFQDKYQMSYSLFAPAPRTIDEIPLSHVNKLDAKP